MRTNLDTGLTFLNKEWLAWASGIYEGEGNCNAYADNRDGCVSISLLVQMNDEDIVKRLKEIFPFGNCYSMVKNGRVVWIFKASGFEKVQATIAAMWPFLGERRRRQAKGFLIYWRDSWMERRENSDRPNFYYSYKRKGINA